MKKDIKEIAEILDLQTIETTRSANGYPEAVKIAIDASSLESFEQVQKVAEKYNLTPTLLHRRDGSHFWTRKHSTSEPIELSDADFGDDFYSYSLMPEDEFCDTFIHERVENFNTLETVKALVDQSSEIWEKMQEMDEGDILVTHLGQFYNIYRRKTLSFSEDTHNWMIALM